eukprot:1050207-Pelagomonas_calceolata.AAC.2
MYVMYRIARQIMHHSVLLLCSRFCVYVMIEGEREKDKTLCIPFTKRNKRKKSKGIRSVTGMLVTGSSPCLTLVMKVERSLLESVFGASKFIRIG